MTPESAEFSVGIIVNQFLIVKKMSEAGLIDKKEIIETLSSWVRGLTIIGKEAEIMAQPLNILMALLNNDDDNTYDNATQEDMLRVLFELGKKEPA